MSIIEEIKERLSIFKNIYDVLRIINPLNNKVVVVEGDSVVEIQGDCYDIWKRDEGCKKCISHKAYIDNDTVIKLEYNAGKIFLVTATPINICGEIYVVEMIKDISQSGLITNKDKDYEETIGEFLEQVRENTVMDDLTGVYNRRYIRERLSEDIKSALKNNYPMSIIMADIDYFKEINDTYGHSMGDKVLQDFTLIASKYIRNNTTDWIARYGGEEFLIVLNSIDEEDAQIIAERIRVKLEETTFIHNGESINITCSFGVQGLKDMILSMEELIDMADRKLYEAKENGRNKTVGSNEEID
ncbi:GGDEF domain-containing protein [Clostridium sp.]|uniref:GGDEF domain-containing protein n=1 Tax=Clostridium sp. TaxID=1506 RepID=UPI0032170938